MELVINVGSSGEGVQTAYQDGDILDSFSESRTDACHIEMICSKLNFGMNSSGFREPGTLFEKYLSKTRTYKFIRLNGSQVKRINLITLEEDVLSPTKNENNESINPYEYLSRRVKSPNHEIFMTAQGKAVWYGRGLNIIDNEALRADLWNDIETDTDKLRINHTNWPSSPREICRHLVIKSIGYKGNKFQVISNGTVCSFSDSEIIQIPDPEGTDLPIGEVEIVAKRRSFIPYWDLSASLGIDISDVRNPIKPIDARIENVPDRPKIDDIRIDKKVAGII